LSVDARPRGTWPGDSLPSCRPLCRRSYPTYPEDRLCVCVKTDITDTDGVCVGCVDALCVTAFEMSDGLLFVVS
jgi:hypothetical protein